MAQERTVSVTERRRTGHEASGVVVQPALQHGHGGVGTAVPACGGGARALPAHATLAALPPLATPPAPLLPAATPAAAPAFEDIYARHAAFVFRNLRRLGVPERHLDDAVQDVFVVVHRRLTEFEGRSAVTTWLFAIVLGVGRNYRRSHRRHAAEAPGGDDPDELIGAPAERPDRRAEQAQAVRVLCTLLDELDEDKREAFVLSQLEGMTAPEISEALGVNVNTVYARIRAATKAFEQAVARFRARGAEPEPDAIEGRT